MGLQLSPGATALLVSRLLRPSQLSPLAMSAERHERALKNLLLQAVESLRASIRVTKIAYLVEQYRAPGAVLYVVEPAIMGMLDTLLGDLSNDMQSVVAHRAFIRDLKGRKKKIPDVLMDAMSSGAKSSGAKSTIKGMSWASTMAFDVANPEAIAWAETHAAELVTDVTVATRQAIRYVISEAFVQGMAPRETAVLIRAMVGLTERDAAAVMRQQLRWLEDGVTPTKAASRAEAYAAKLLRARARTIARTETLKASHEGVRRLWAEASRKGLLSPTAEKEWLYSGPARAGEPDCPICTPLDGERVALNADFSIGTDPPAHPNCLLENALVLPGSAVAGVSKRAFDGDVIILRMAGGRELACTPNHPILTMAGWVPACLLDVGSNIVCDGRSEWRGIVCGDHEQMPTVIQEVVNSILETSEVSASPVPTAPEDFHGDGSGSKVAVIGTNRKLRNGLNVKGKQPFAEQSFVAVHAASALNADRFPAQFIHAGLNTTSSSVRSTDLDRAGSFVHHVPSKEVRVGHISESYSTFSQSPYHNRTTDAELAAQLIRGSACKVFFDKVVNVERNSFHGFVYNLETLTGWYAANGIITQNCRCTMVIA